MTSAPTPTPSKFFLRTNLIASANGSSFYESSTSKIVVSVQGPRPLSKTNNGYFPTAIVSIDFKYAPFATRERVGYQKSTRERAIGQLLGTAIRPSILTKLFPKSEIAVNVMVLEESKRDGEGEEGSELQTIAGAITAASAAIADAGIDCTDLVSGGVIEKEGEVDGERLGVVVGYMPHREEMTMFYVIGEGVKSEVEDMVREACEQAKVVNMVVNKVLLE